MPLLPMAVAIYFLFPYLNEEKHQEVAEKHADDFMIGDTTDVDAPSFSSLAEYEGSENESGNVEDIGQNFSELKEQTEEYQKNIEELKLQMDSLRSVNDSLKQELAGKVDPGSAEISEEEFAENVKSLLDLDVEELSPILNKMEDEKLEQIFKAGSGLQRKKLLRSMESDRAAKLMTEVL